MWFIRFLNIHKKEKTSRAIKVTTNFTQKIWKWQFLHWWFKEITFLTSISNFLSNENFCRGRCDYDLNLIMHLRYVFFVHMLPISLYLPFSMRGIIWWYLHYRLSMEMKLSWKTWITLIMNIFVNGLHKPKTLY